MRGEDRHQMQLLVVSAGYINTGFGKILDLCAVCVTCTEAHLQVVER